MGFGVWGYRVAAWLASSPSLAKGSYSSGSCLNLPPARVRVCWGEAVDKSRPGRALEAKVLTLGFHPSLPPSLPTSLPPLHPPDFRPALTRSIIHRVSALDVFQRGHSEELGRDAIYRGVPGVLAHEPLRAAPQSGEREARGRFKMRETGIFGGGVPLCGPRCTPNARPGRDPRLVRARP